MTNTRMHAWRWTTAIALAAMSAAAGGQPQQTAEGAQQFLLRVASERIAPATLHFADVTVQYAYTTYEKKMLRGWVEYRSGGNVLSGAQEAEVVRLESPDPCTTVIPALTFTPEQRKTREEPNFNEEYYTNLYRWIPSFAAAMAPPHAIAWGKAKISRTPQAVVATVPDAKFKQTSLVMRTQDPDMLERLEYAMKFLQMSCDPTADTGF